MFSKLALLSALATLAVAAPAGTTIQKVVINGSGCPAGSFSSSSSGDTVSIKFSQFQSSVGNGSDPSDARANCQAIIQVNAPAGFQFAPRNVVYSGSVDINSAVTASRSSLYYFQGQTAQSLTSTSATGPLNANGITVTDTFDQSKGGFSACGGSSIVNVNVAISVDNGSTSASGMNSVTTARIGDFVWQAC